LKKNNLLLIAALFCTATIVHLRPYERRSGFPRPRHASEMDVNERMLLQRSYPDPHFDLRAYHAGVIEAARERDQASNTRSLEWITQGPGNIGGRFNCIVAHPNDPDIIYAGAATGGVFKTTNGGVDWVPVFDEQPYLSIGCIALDPTDPNTVWVGTGDANISGLVYTGDGIYKSSDGGDTWTHMGLSEQHVLSSIVIDPGDPNVLYVGAMGNPFAHDNNRGLYKTMDGGANWEQVLFVSDQAGVIDLVMDPTNSSVLYASSFDRIRSNAERIAHGPGSRIWKTVDAGANWIVLSNGLPPFNVGRIGITIYPSDPDILYACIADSTYHVQGVYKTTNGGSTWNALNTSDLDNYGGFGWYFGKIHVNPGNPDQVYVLGVDSYTTSNGGFTWDLIAPEWWLYEVHADHHGMYFIDPQTILLCTDGGLYRTTNNCATWTDIDNIPVNQVYHAIENPHIPEEYWCGVQDNGTSKGAAINIDSWQRIWGGDGFLPAIDPENADVVYAESQYGNLVFSDDGGDNFQDGTSGIDFNDRVNWDMSYFISALDHTVLYCGTDKVYRMDNAPYGFWQPISDDLTDGLDDDPDDMHTITTVAGSPLSPNVLYAGTADANVWASTNEGDDWTNVTGTLPVRYVTAVTASPNEANTVYVTHSGYRDNEYIPHVHRSANNGGTWVDISGDLPQVGVNDILITPGIEQLLFVSTDVGVYYSNNGGLVWQRLGENMPLMPVFDIELSIDGTRLVASTFARSVQTIDITDLLIVSVSEGVAQADGPLVFPVPAVNEVNVQWPGHSVADYTVYNSAGERVATGRSTSSAFRIAVNHLPKGGYVLELSAKEQRAVQRFVKQ
jgi:photosystem II stability/assembly factor-like uncharacterized protein